MGFKTCDLIKYLHLISLHKGLLFEYCLELPLILWQLCLLFFITQGDREDIGKVGERGNELDLRVLT